jgi:hypothetical protein
MIRIRFKLLAKTLDERSKVVDLVAIVGSPYRLQQFPMRYGFIGMLCEISEQLQFRRG